MGRLLSYRRTKKLSTLTISGRVRAVASHVLREVLPSLFMRSGNRSTLFRIHAIIARLATGERVTANTMAKLLEVSERTIARDIDYIVNALHVPMDYDFKRKSYVLSGPIPTFYAVPPTITSANSVVHDISTVEFALDQSLADGLRTTKLHPSQRILNTPDGLRLRLEVPPNDALVQWTLGFGSRLRVVSPQHFRDRVVAAAQAIVDAAKQADP